MPDSAATVPSIHPVHARLAWSAAAVASAIAVAFAVHSFRAPAEAPEIRLQINTLLLNWKLKS